MRFDTSGVGCWVFRFFKVSALAGALFLFGLAFEASAVEIPALQVDDCPKCHQFQVKMVAAEGGKHSTEISCLDCHPQHPPEGTETMTPCVDCHEGEAHFEIGDCQQCHAIPHKPLASLRDPQKPTRKECLSCHDQVGAEMTASPSKHAQLFCNNCHSSHKLKPACTECHDPHLEGQVAADCLHCHPAHQPLKITPTGYVPATYCRVCHEDEANSLAQTKTNHGSLNCVNCHSGQHPSVPSCNDCHGLPHAQAIHSKFKSCLECHGDAHRLVSGK